MVHSVVLVVNPVHVFLVLGSNNVVSSINNFVTSENIAAILAGTVSLPDSAGKAALNGISLLIGDSLHRSDTFIEGDGRVHLGPWAVPNLVGGSHLAHDAVTSAKTKAVGAHSEVSTEMVIFHHPLRAVAIDGGQIFKVTVNVLALNFQLGDGGA